MKESKCISQIKEEQNAYNFDSSGTNFSTSFVSTGVQMLLNFLFQAHKGC